MAETLCSYLDTLHDRSEPVVRLASPDELREKFAEVGVPLSLVDGAAQQAVPESDLMKATQQLLKYSVRTGHPHFFNQLYGRADPVSIAADWASVATNTNCHTYEVAPVYTVMEHEVLKKIATVIGGDYVNQHEGLFVPGGSLSNLYGMHLARGRADPKLATRGAVGGPQLVAFTSDQAHYSYLKNARLIGLGSDNLVNVKTDGQGRMDPAALQEAVSRTRDEGKTPFFVGSTAGTTVLGAYDPFIEISRICEKENMWHNIDACWGGSAMLSPKWRHLMAGAELADSIAWNPHKMMGTTLQTSIFILRHTDALKGANATNAKYLFQPDKLYTEYDSGDKTIQCGRKTDMFKLWLMWKSKGDAGMAATVDHCFDLAKTMSDTILQDTSGAWQLVYEPSCTNVCFWYVPEALRPFDLATATEEQVAALHSVAPKIKNHMQKTGDAMIGFQSVNEKPNFFRIVFAAGDTITHDDVTGLLSRMAKIGEDLAA